MSAGIEAEEAGTIWQSEDDILKDLALLNDFCISGDTQPHRILYSIGRGSKLKQKRETDKNLFVDPRTGEPIDADNIELSRDDFMYESKGRGKHLGRFLVNKFQLLEQLRRARPLGSGDEAIESYCRRNIPKETSTPVCQNPKTVVKNSNVGKPLLGVRGSRNSVQQTNVLISNLLSKAKESSNAALISNKEQFCSDTEDDDDEDSSSKSGCLSEKYKRSILNGQNDEKEGKRKEGNKDGGGRHTTAASKFNNPEDLYDFERESVTSDESNASFSVYSDKDFPPLHTCFKKQFC